MKKLLSILLICTLLLSAIPFVTASAEVTSANAKVVSIDGEKKTLSEWFALAAGSAMEGKEVTLLSDITVNSWTTVSKFSGILNGNGHSISGLNVPMFSRLDGATIKNLTVNGSFDGLKSKMIGAIACETVGNVMLQNVICNVNMDIHQSTGNVGFGGLIGYVNGGKTVLTDCVNNGDIYASDTTSCYSGAMAGMVGWTVNNTELIATRCVNTGNVYGSTTNANGDATNTIVLGGIVGWANSSVTLVGCMNYGEVKNTAPSAHGGCKVGGLAGIMNPSADSDAQFIFEDCVNYGDVLGYRCAGGMVGQLTHKLEMTNCYNYGSIRSGYGESSVNATTSFASGLIGILGANKGGAVIVACANYGDLSTTSNKGYHEVYAGGAVAYLECPAELISFSNHGTVSAMKYVGGIVANVAKDGIDINIRNCLSAGVVSIQENAMSDPASAAMIGNIAKGNVSFFDSAYLPTVNANVSNGTASGVSSEITSVESVSAWKDMQEISFEGFQYSAVENGTFKLRLVSSVASIDYSCVGYEIIRTIGTDPGTLNKEINTVYESLIGFDENGVKTEYKASDFNAQYLAALVINGIPAEGTVTFTIRPYVMDKDGVTVTYGDAFSLTLIDGVYSAS